MCTIKTALVALATTLCVTFTFSENTEETKKEKLKNRIRHHLRHSALRQTNSRSKDTLWNSTNGWNYFEVTTVQYPTEVITEIYGEIILETLVDGPSQYSDLSAFFGMGWHKSLTGKKLKTTNIENVTLSTDGLFSGGDTTSIDSVHYEDTLINMAYYDMPDTSKGSCHFFPDGRLKEITLNDGNEAIYQLFCRYNDNKDLSEYIFREIDLDAGLSDGGYQERYTLTYNENKTLRSVISVDEMLDPDLQIGDTEPGDTVLYTYDTEGTLTEITTIASWTGSYKSRTTYKYDEQDRIILSTTYSWDTLTNKWGHDRWDDSTLFTYDNSGNIVSIEEFEYDTDQFSLAYTYTYEFDAKGNLTEEIIYDYDGATKTLSDSTLYAYNDQNNLTTMTFFDGQNALPEISAVHYSDGLPSAIVETYGDSLNLYELIWETITPIVQTTTQSTGIKPQVHRIGNRLILSGVDFSQAEIFTVQGKKVHGVTLQKRAGFSELNLNNLATGTYMLKVQSIQGVMTSKIRL